MNLKQKLLNAAAVLSVVLYYGVFFLMCGHGFDESKCVDLGLMIAPLFIPILILVPLAIIIDLSLLAHKLTRRENWRLIDSLISITVISATILWLMGLI